MDTRNMSVMDHIVELRRRIVLLLVFFAVAFIAGFFLATPLITYLTNAPMAQGLPMNAFKMTDPFRVFMTFATVIALVFIFPVILYQLWAFISPGLHENERKVTLAYIPFAFILFLGGLSFAYFVLFPFIIQFMGNLSARLGITEQYGINEYFHFLFQITIPMGILFQLPVIVSFLTRLGLVTPSTLSKLRKYAYFVLLVIAGFITPPDLMSHLMVTVPLLLLYEFSIWLSRIAYRKVLKAQKLQEEELERTEAQ
ncbi:preprotein translocase subunit TatC [Alkalihalobacillus alcalophilus ATCC 27647 = CGMCC 1.3604]|uniref:Sec-independent protein translocase protein TatC n=2 Tax=Alkalihalobacillus alcalophilus ATCC 27647 = CGMCC 1.3604 TaxID=1218173 RepID=A0A094WP76_ALKAL|nr:twin-arginine translocase subunit TatC [Alkalihalobacillus alcalophilus]KGA97783.1 preprotein translocase subunit TatC [Alkalihalobacillus alcalophilus ATCC 27647 = CGMCC 1.3604]MED1562454.1 twin-arginine translocase subunit TatC [Alkalihalobacillus alcalophilus]THG90751.1 preprotein translocase subunit TatC [Alkalihalobacillus alcalophilus ATCC 27647 = CGMCC 1.3604]